MSKWHSWPVLSHSALLVLFGVVARSRLRKPIFKFSISNELLVERSESRLAAIVSAFAAPTE